MPRAPAPSITKHGQLEMTVAWHALRLEDRYDGVAHVRAGACKYLTKPIAVHHLLAVFDEMLEDSVAQAS